MPRSPVWPKPMVRVAWRRFGLYLIPYVLACPGLIFSVGLIEHFDPPGASQFPYPTWLYRATRGFPESEGEIEDRVIAGRREQGDCREAKQPALRWTSAPSSNSSQASPPRTTS